MKILKLWINTGYCGADYEEEFEVPDDYTEEQCEIEMEQYVSNHIEYGWSLEDVK